MQSLTSLDHKEYVKNALWFLKELHKGYQSSDSNYLKFNQWLVQTDLDIYSREFICWGLNLGYSEYCHYVFSVAGDSGLSFLLRKISKSLELWDAVGLGLPDFSSPQLKTSRHSFDGFGVGKGRHTVGFYGCIFAKNYRFYFFDDDPLRVTEKSIVCLLFFKMLCQDDNSRRNLRPHDPGWSSLDY